MYIPLYLRSLTVERWSSKPLDVGSNPTEGANTGVAQGQSGRFISSRATSRNCPPVQILNEDGEEAGQLLQHVGLRP